MTDKILKLVSKNDKTPQQGEEAKALVVDFLRRYADAIEDGTEDGAHKAILILYEDRGDMFCVRSRLCNVTVLERAGMYAMATHDALET